MTSSNPPAERARAPVLLLTMVLAAAPVAYGQSFVENTLKAPFVVETAVVAAHLADAGVRDLLVSGRDVDGRNWLVIYRLNDASTFAPDPVARRQLPPEILFFDVGRLGGEALDQIYFLTPEHILRYDAGADEVVELLPMHSSLYRLPRSDAVRRLDFVRDLDGDGRDDVIVAGFDGYRIHLQDDAGELGRSQLLPVPPRARLRGASPRYEPHELHRHDLNRDGRPDLAWLDDRAFQVFQQLEGGGFDTTARTVPIGLDLPSEAELERLERDDDVDQSDLTVNRILSVKDLNDDGVVDIITHAEHSSGVFDKRSDYRIHLGRRAKELVSWGMPADSLIKSQGLQFDLETVDIDGDGKLDLMSPSVKVSLPRVIAALFSGNASVRLSFYNMQGDGTYPEEATYATKARVEFDLSSGRVRYPAVEIADFDGDGLGDLLVQTAPQRFTIFRGTGDGQLFEKRGASATVLLPRRGDRVEAEDLNGDGRADLVIRYTEADGAELVNIVRILIAIPEEPVPAE